MMSVSVNYYVNYPFHQFIFLNTGPYISIFSPKNWNLLIECKVNKVRNLTFLHFHVFVKICIFG
jgi:hypothetical protein